MPARYRWWVFYPWLIAAAVLVARGSEPKPAADKITSSKPAADKSAAGDHGAKESGSLRAHEKPSPVGAEVKKDDPAKGGAKKEDTQKNGHSGGHASASKASHGTGASNDPPHKQGQAKNIPGAAANPAHGKGSGSGKPAEHAKTGDHGKTESSGKTSTSSHSKAAGSNAAGTNHAAGEASKEPSAPTVLKPGSYVRDSRQRPRSAAKGKSRPARDREDGPFVVNVTESMEPDPRTPDETLQLLVRGNQSYVAARPFLPRPGPATLRNDSPKLIALSCADAAVAPETMFGLSGSDLVSVRVAGAVASREQTASIAYTFTYADPKLLLVLGHLDCPVTRAVVEGERMPGELAALLAPLVRAVDKARYYNPSLRGDELLLEATKVNVWTSVQDLTRGSEMIARRLRTGALKVVGGVFDFRTGKVNWMGEYPAQLSSALR